MTEEEKFYRSMQQEIVAQQLSDEDGNTQEQVFTRMVIDILSDAGETENATIGYDERFLGTKDQLKINGYAISDNYETVDLFISIYNPSVEIIKATKKEIEQAGKRITNFFRKSIYGDYASHLADASEIFEFANTLGQYQELKDNLIRVNAFIITNKEYKEESISSTEISGYKIYYRIIDINYLYRISKDAHASIEIDFAEEGYNVPCATIASENDRYQAYIAIIPGICLANLYEKYGSRLLEQNVRSFLQFSGKINKGMRSTIINEPHMFLAYNNGIAATADNIILNTDKHCIKYISNLQIVNGGQTTAAIYHTWKKFKVDLSNIYVQVKFSVIRKSEDYTSIVSRISQYSNTQNKVNDADFTSNNPGLIEIEKLSRFIMTPITDHCSIQTNWFFERVRGQYKTLKLKDGFTKSREKAFECKYPKKQMFTKVELAKYVNSYKEVWDGKKLVVGPHIVVKGNEKNYAIFINNQLPDIKKIDNIYFEDCIAKAILFKDADKRYGIKGDAFNLGQMRQVAVPYAISLLNIITKDKLNLYKIWQNQSVSKELSDFMYNLMAQINDYIKNLYLGGNPIEASKNEETWTKVKEQTWKYNIEDIMDDLIDENHPPQRKSIKEKSSDDTLVQHELDIIKSIPYKLWNKISEWGKDSGYLDLRLQTRAKEIADSLRFNHKLKDNERNSAMSIYEIVCDKNIELLEEADELVEEENRNHVQIVQSNDKEKITLDLVKKMVKWDRGRRILEDWKWKAMDNVARGVKPLTENMKKKFYYNLIRLEKAGFNYIE
jgi:hypothetical protein